jgi:hypothetical protein
LCRLCVSGKVAIMRAPLSLMRICMSISLTIRIVVRIVKMAQRMIEAESFDVVGGNSHVCHMRLR